MQRGRGNITVSYKKPPIPREVLCQLDLTKIQQYPRWYPTIGMLRAYEQELRCFTHLDPSDAASTYQYARILSGGLQSGQQRDYTKPIEDDISVLFWQEQKCNCNIKGSKLKGVCKPNSGNNCTPFYIILMEHWQRQWVADHAHCIRVLFLDETHGVCDVRYLPCCYIVVISAERMHLCTSTSL